MNTTFNLCANFGHNFYREKEKGKYSDVVKCKNCSKEIQMNRDGDYEDTKGTKAAISRVMQKLNLLRSQYSIKNKKQASTI
ncbi:MAG: hypothetical protein KJO49_12985 [Bacteroidia bacterium]|nr:hypothetical protein [Bacteroidia bacterium]MBT8269274.1 hypothetical protein [Bacteroidia bacterium]NNF81315.1 hypothetical protein [Flavobacteriaceae bacterium]NNK70613.1 hypothetical protein [Flavobacteriaceae bacterium]NNL79950.1 hypothetical protein [Flavobacteriaceae bacterium]